MADINTITAESGLINALYGEIGQANNAQATAAALALQAGGNDAEAAQYAISGQLSTQNANLELVSGQIQQFQTMRQLTKTIGAQTAGVAGAGFQGSGSAMSLARSSLQQGLLQSQVEGVNSDIAAGGYFQQAASAAAQGTAATTAAGVARVNSTAATNIANLAIGQANMTKGFLSQIPGFDPNNPFGGSNTMPAYAQNNPFGGQLPPNFGTGPATPNWNHWNSNPATNGSSSGGLPQIPAAFGPAGASGFNPFPAATPSVPSGGPGPAASFSR